MIYTPKQPAAPEWLEILASDGKRKPVEMLFAPATPTTKRKAQLLARAEFGDRDEDAPLSPLDLIDLGDAFSRSLVRITLKGWKGIGDENGAWPFTPENVDRVLADDELFEAIDAKFIVPIALRDREKNGSSASPSGTGEAAMRGKTTAASPVAVKKRTGAAKRAPTSSKPSRPMPGKASGKR